VAQPPPPLTSPAPPWVVPGRWFRREGPFVGAHYALENGSDQLRRRGVCARVRVGVWACASPRYFCRGPTQPTKSILSTQLRNTCRRPCGLLLASCSGMQSCPTCTQAPICFFPAAQRSRRPSPPVLLSGSSVRQLQLLVPATVNYLGVLQHFSPLSPIHCHTASSCHSGTAWKRVGRRIRWRTAAGTLRAPAQRPHGGSRRYLPAYWHFVELPAEQNEVMWRASFHPTTIRRRPQPGPMCLRRVRSGFASGPFDAGRQGHLTPAECRVHGAAKDEVHLG
jgi:hypothetical protein